MVVDQVNIAGGVRLFVIAENQTPVSGYGQAPESFQVAFERMHLPTRKSAELVEALGGLESEQKLVQLVGHGRGHRFGVTIFMEPLQSFMAKAGKLHLSPSQIQLCTVLPYTVKRRSRNEQCLKPDMGQVSCGDLVELGQIAVDHYLLPSERIDASLDELWDCR